MQCGYLIVERIPTAIEPPQGTRGDVINQRVIKFAKGLVSTPLLCGMEITPDCDVDFLFPHAVFSFIFESHPVEFTRRFLGGAANNVARH